MRKNMAIGLAVGLGLMAGMVVRAEEGGADKAADAKKQADTLVATARSCIEKAKALVGDEQKEARDKEYAAAARAYAGALEICPGWEVDDVADKGHWDRWFARQKRGDLWKAMKQYDKAREEYQKGFEIPAQDMLDLRSFIQMTIADSYFEEQNWIAAEEAYLKVEEIGLYGDRKHLVPAQLEKVKPLAEAQRKKQAEKAAPKP